MSRESLLQYQAEDRWVFHGSLNGEIAELEPRQAMNHQKPDGNPAVFAAGSVEPAIFMAILGSRKMAGWDSDTFTKPFGFFISESGWQQAQAEQWTGFVYVLSRRTFVKDTGWSWRSSVSITPQAIVPVGFADLSKDIAILSAAEEAEYLERNP